MGITERQRERRRNNVGASDVPIILGLSPYKTPADLCAGKRGLLDDVIEETEDMALGRAFESSILDLASNELGALRRNQERRVYHDGNPTVILAHCDAIVGEWGTPVEAKTAGLRRGWTPDEWIDGPPPPVTLQLQTQMMACAPAAMPSTPFGHVAAFVPGQGFSLTRIEADREIQEMILEAVRAFWACVQSCTLPPEPRYSEDVLRRLRRAPNSWAEAPDLEAIAEWEELRAQRLAVERRERDARERALTSLGECEGADLGNGQWLTYCQSKASLRLDEKALRAAEPDVWERYAVERPGGRVARIVKAKTR